MNIIQWLNSVLQNDNTVNKIIIYIVKVTILLLAMLLFSILFTEYKHYKIEAQILKLKELKQSRIEKLQ